MPCDARAELGADDTSTPTIQAAEASTATALDLSFEPALPTEPAVGAVVPRTSVATPGQSAEAPFSLGVKIKTRPPAMGSPAARATSDPQEPPTLVDKVEGIVERSTIGVTGTYRF